MLPSLLWPLARPWLAARMLPEELARATVQVVRIGPVALIGAPADLASSVGLPLIEAARKLGLRVFFVSMADDWIGYVMRQEEYLELEYKETTQFHGADVGALLTAVYQRLIDQLAERVRLESRFSLGHSASPSETSNSGSESVPN